MLKCLYHYNTYDPRLVPFAYKKFYRHPRLNTMTLRTIFVIFHDYDYNLLVPVQLQVLLLYSSLQLQRYHHRYSTVPGTSDIFFKGRVVTSHTNPARYTMTNY
jgi:hypothetical protein